MVAAGRFSRVRTPEQLLEIGSQTLLRRTVQTALHKQIMQTGYR
jgi:CTP:molybdopterin cytidylyltransferase MocA